jgi:hypothetical protein
MSFYQFVIKCPECSTSTTLIAYESNPLIFECQGCHKGVVMQGIKLYTVSPKYVTKIVKNYKTLTCGRVLASVISDEAKSLITDEKIKDLQTILDSSQDVSDIIKNL